MSRVSNRALINFVVDSAIAVAFAISAVSGLVFLIPSGWLSVFGSTTSVLGVDFATWRTLHDWTAVIMIAGVVLHTALHWNWVTTMVRRLAGGGRAQARADGGRAPARPAAAPHDAAPVLAATAVTAPLSTAVGGEDVTAPTWSAAAGPAQAKTGLTRNAFLKRAGAVGAAALAGGLVGRAAASAAVSWMDDTSSASQGASSAVQDSTATNDAAGSGTTSDTGAGSSSTWGDQSAQSSSSAARVTIDAGRCTGCGDCLRVCPYGVFAASGSQAVVTDADACRLCGHCTQVCRDGAITLNG